jgi:hypothetical protein
VCFFRRKNWAHGAGRHFLCGDTPRKSCPECTAFFCRRTATRPPLHIATHHTPFSWRCHHSIMECASYYVQPQGDITALYSLSPSFRTRSEDTGGAWGCVRGLGAPLRGRRRQKPPSVAYSPRDALSGALGRSWWAGGAMRAHIGLQSASGSRWGARERPGGGQGERRRRRAVRAGGQRVGARGGSGSGAAMRCCCGRPNNGGRARASPRPGRGSGDRSPE